MYTIIRHTIVTADNCGQYFLISTQLSLFKMTMSDIWLGNQHWVTLLKMMT